MPLPWAKRFDAEVKRRILSGEQDGLIDYEALGEDARLAIPTPEHYLPLLYTLGLQRKGETVSFFNEVVTGSISMTSVVVGAQT